MTSLKGTGRLNNVESFMHLEISESVSVTSNRRKKKKMMILPWSVEFDEGETFGHCLIEVVLCEVQHAGLQRGKKL